MLACWPCLLFQKRANFFYEPKGCSWRTSFQKSLLSIKCADLNNSLWSHVTTTHFCLTIWTSRGPHSSRGQERHDLHSNILCASMLQGGAQQERFCSQSGWSSDLSLVEPNTWLQTRMFKKNKYIFIFNTWEMQSALQFFDENTGRPRMMVGLCQIPVFIITKMIPMSSNLILLVSKDHYITRQKTFYSHIRNIKIHL